MVQYLFTSGNNIVFSCICEETLHLFYVSALNILYGNQVINIFSIRLGESSFDNNCWYLAPMSINIQKWSFNKISNLKGLIKF